MKPTKTWYFLLLLTPLLPVGASSNHPSEGEIIFSELMLDAEYSLSYEYVEFYSRAAETRSLDGCVLNVHKLEDESKTCDDLAEVEGGVAGRCDTLTGVEIGAGQLAWVARNLDDHLESCDVMADGEYASVDFLISVGEAVELWCAPDGTFEVVASMEYNWKTVTDYEKGRSWQLREEYLESGDASSKLNWCVAPDDAHYCTFSRNDTTYEHYGTPGDANVCSERMYHPGPGDMVFTEINPWPSSTSSSPEFVELKVLEVPNEYSTNLKNCQLSVFNCESGLAPDICLRLPLTADDYTKSYEFEGLFELTKGDLVTLIGSDEDLCLEVAAGGGCAKEADLAYDPGKLTMGYDSTVRRVDLLCPDDESGEMAVVDGLVYTKGWIDDRCCQEDGNCSWELRPDVWGAQDDSPDVANDDPDNWGPAEPNATYYSAAIFESAELERGEGSTTTTSGEAQFVESYGTPGSDNSVGARIDSAVVTPGDIVITELAIWYTTSTDTPDWVEIDVVGDPGDGVFDLSACEMRGYACESDMSWQECIDLDLTEAWEKTDRIEVFECKPEPDIWLKAGDLAILGASSSKGCVEIDEAGECTAPVAGAFSSNVGLSGTGTRLLELACPDALGVFQTIDRVIYDKSWVGLTCDREDGHCTWALRPNRVGAADNDDPQAWGTSEASHRETGGTTVLGTPLQPNDVMPYLETNGYPRAGEVVFSELMVDAADGNPEWMELQVAPWADSSALFDLGGCQLLKQRLETGADGRGVLGDLCAPDDPGDCQVFPIPDVISLLIGDLGEELGAAPRRVLSKAVCLSRGPGDGDAGSSDECDVLADLTYGKIDFTTNPEAIALWCPSLGEDGWTLVDEMTQTWSAMKSLCTGEVDGEPVSACTLAVHPDYLDSNDCVMYQCVTTPDQAYYDNLEGGISAGTPGAANKCPPAPEPPQAYGELVISELFIAPIADAEADEFANEWFELYNATERPLDLATCTLVLIPEDEEGTVLQEDAKYSPQYANPVTIQPGDYQLWAVNGCLYGKGECDFGESVEEEDASVGSELSPTPADPGAPATASDDSSYFADVAYSGLSFPNEGLYHFEIRCEVGCGDEQLIDAVSFDFSEYGIERGHSWQVKPEAMAADDNDARENWCQGAFDQDYQETRKGNNFGTPGEANECQEIPDCPEIRWGCRCSVAGSSEQNRASIGLLLLGLGCFGFVSRRSRRR